MIFKAVKSNAILVSTPDGGAADVDENTYLVVKSPDELSSLYTQMDKALDIVEGDNEEWATFLRNQLAAFIKIIATGRMLEDYLKLIARTI
ncbi:MAG: hypothetical protein COY78_04000 [Candidatus Omnitrophica bacterium CG_4_10_14_0_8_um_filter_44_12]|nr:MAG: hypothetical protein COY78_04000 [Candidatus Omnitrophica bacterium CG_4_10_14_0_8_um_filter_44_12]